MLTDEALLRIAEEEIPRVFRPYNGRRCYRGAVYLIGDPPGAWVEPRLLEGWEMLDGPLPFFISRDDGAVIRFARGVRGPAEGVLHEWVRGGAIGVLALAFHVLPEPPQASREAWARAWLVNVPRYAMLRVPSAGELLAQMPMLAFLTRGEPREAG